MPIQYKNLNQFSASDIGHVWVGLWNGDYLEGSDGSLANGEDSGMARLLAATNVVETNPPLPWVNVDSDRGVDGVVAGRKDAPDTIVFSGGVMDQILMTMLSNLVEKAEGPDDLVADSDQCITLNPVHIIVNSPGRSRDSANYGKQGYIVREYLYVIAQDRSQANWGRGVVGTHDILAAAQYTDRLPWGELITVGNYGVDRMWALKPYWSQYPVTAHAYVGDGSTTTVTLDETPASADGDAVQVWGDGTKETYTTDYTVVTSTKVLTWEAGSIPAAGVNEYIKYKYVPSC